MQTRLNLCTPVREALVSRGVSTIRVVDAVNAALGALEVEKQKTTLGSGSISKKSYRVTETQTTKFSGARNVCLDFDAFNGMVEKLEKKFPSFNCTIPVQFHCWLDKMILLKDPTDIKTKDIEVREASPEECAAVFAGAKPAGE